ncbi:hypothetical protein JKP88DRAFT_348536 [Tribonema minus]|uniref:NB-ARC domain-containing protein n=1 Tax=Tribonema minus TaxID=303371 RepID=A0A836CFU9_9STRA|nr:hypothetical protein JKP88DRAFT_348536 [Tribonema minus]
MVKDNQDVKTACLSCKEKCERLKGTLDELLELEPNLREHVEAVFSVLHRLAQSLLENDGRGSIVRFISAGATKSTISDLNGKIDSAIVELALAVGEATLKSAHMIESAVIRPDREPLNVEGTFGHQSLLSSEELQFSPGEKAQVVMIHGRGADKDVIYVQQELLKQLSDCAVPAHTAMAGELQKQLGTPKLLLLDNIWTAAQLGGLRGKLVGGSFVIVTTRNTHVLDWHTADVKEFPMPELEHDDALALFRSSAGLEEPPPTSLQKLELEIVGLCGGMPLALAVAGGGLRHKTAMDDWKEVAAALRSGQGVAGDGDGRMRALLKLSLKGLEACEKEMFLDACTVMYGRNPDDARCAWQAMYSDRALAGSVIKLKNRSLLEIHKDERTGREHLWVHDVLKAIGGARAVEGTRVWKPEQEAKPNVRAIVLHEQAQLNDEQGGARDLQVLLMDELRSTVDLDHILRISGTQLKWLSLPPSTGTLPDFARFKGLVVLDCSMCNELADLRPISVLKKLKMLCLQGYWRSRPSSLPESIGNLTALTSLDLSCCKVLSSLPPSFGNLTALTTLSMRYCERLTELPDSFGNLTALTSLSLAICERLTSLPDSFSNLTALTSLDLSSCSVLSSLPPSFGNLTALTSLDLSGNLFYRMTLRDLPDSFGNLTALKSLNLGEKLGGGCKSLMRLPKSFGNLTALTTLSMCSCKRLTELPESFGDLTALTSLNLLACEALSSLPESFGNLTALTSLDLRHCESLYHKRYSTLDQ